MQKYIIGIDNSTQSSKVVIFDLNGNEIVVAKTLHLPMLHRHPGWAEFQGEDLWHATKASLMKAINDFPYARESIVAIGLCTVGCSRVFFKKDASLQAPVMSWMDTRAYEAYQDDAEIAYTSSTTAYINYKLTGELKDAAANAYQWQFPVDLKTLDWLKDKASFDKYKIPREKLLAIYKPGEILGYLSKQVSEETGLPFNIPIVATANDKPVEAIGCGIVDKSLALLSFGTATASYILSDGFFEDGINYYTYPSAIPYKYIYSSPVVRYGMGHITWLKNLLGEHVSYDILESEASKISVGSDGLFIIPDWLPLEKYKKGVILGFMPTHTRGHIYRSFYEGIALTLKNNHQKMTNELGVHPSKFIVAGGGSHSDVLIQICADVFNAKMIKNKCFSSTALGAAVCAAVGIKLYSSFEEAVSYMVTQDKAFEPNENNVQFYDQMNTSFYKGLSDSFQSIFKKATHLGYIN